MELSDNELMMLVQDNIEEARDEAYNRFSYIVDIIINKYKRGAYYFNVDMEELRQEALLGFADGLASFNQNKNTSVRTFITLCVERRITNYLRKYDTDKMRQVVKSYSLDLELGEDATLKDVIGDNRENPSITVESKENIDQLKRRINEKLNKPEKEVYNLLINDYSYEDMATILNMDIKKVYNYVSKIRSKIKEIL